jgi:hypothetical protein
VWQRRADIPARADVDDRRVLLAARGSKIPLRLPLLLPCCPLRLHGVPAEVTAEFADPLARGSKTSFQIFAHPGILACISNRAP